MRARHLVAAGFAAALLASGCAGGDDRDAGGTTGTADATTTTAADPTTSTGATATTPSPAGGPELLGPGDDLYAVPDPLPAGAHGDLVRYQPIETDVEGASAHRVMYLSTSIAGDPIVVTGTVVVPTGPAAPGGRPILTIAHGTTGVADACAPSRSGASELAIAGPAIERGWIVAITDYEGLGTPGRHPYLVGESEGRSVVDAALAAGQLPGAEAGHQLLIAGYSQGGHGALWADRVAAGWAPQLDVVGTFAGAPATELPLILSASGGVPAFGFLLIAGFGAAYPDADPSLVLTDAGLERLDAVDELCIGALFGELAGATDLVRPGGPATAPWPELAAANDPGLVATDDPVLIVHSAEDDVVPVVLSELLLGRMCGLGQHVERRVLERGGSHVVAAVAAYGQALEWFDELLAGQVLPSSCPPPSGS